MAPRKQTKPPGKSERGDRFWHLRARLGKTQEGFPPVTRLQVNNIENGVNQLTGAGLRDKAAEAIGVLGKDLEAYLDGSIELDELLVRRGLQMSTADTLTMADQGAALLTAEKGIPSEKAWLIMRGVKLKDPTPERFAEEAWRRALEEIRPGYSEADYDAAALLDEAPGPKGEIRDIEPGTSPAKVETLDRALPKARKRSRKSTRHEVPRADDKGRSSKPA